jgi:hypothetical protein
MEQTITSIEIMKLMKANFCVKILQGFETYRTDELLYRVASAELLKTRQYNNNKILNPNMSMRMFLEQHDQTNWMKVSEHRATIMDVRKYPHIKWDWHRLSMSKHITQEVITQNPDIPWDYDTMSCNPNITLQFVLNNLDKPWDYECLSCHSNISIQDILQHPEVNWNSRGMSFNQTVKVSDVLNHPEIRWNYNFLSQVLPVDDMLAHPNMPWTEKICMNQSLTPQHIIDHPEVKWNYSMLIYNQNLPLDFLICSCPNRDMDTLIMYRKLTYSEALKYPQLKGKIYELDHPMIDFFDQKINKLRRRLLFDIQERFCQTKYRPDVFVPKMIEEVQKLIQT